MLRITILFLFSFFITPKLTACDDFVLKFASRAKMSEKEISFNINLSRQWLQRLLRMRKKGPSFLVQKINGGVNGQDVEIWGGLPEYAETIKAGDLGIVRHYGPFAEDIVNSQKLIAGSRPFIDPVAAHLRLHYEDLDGIFFTTQDFPVVKLWMGYDHNTPYVDFILPDELEVIRLTDGNFLIPGPPRRADWVKKAYQEYKRTGVIYPGLENAFKEMDEMGGVDIPLEIPIQVEGYSF